MKNRPPELSAPDAAPCVRISGPPPADLSAPGFRAELTAHFNALAWQAAPDGPPRLLSLDFAPASCRLTLCDETAEVLFSFAPEDPTGRVAVVGADGGELWGCATDEAGGVPPPDLCAALAALARQGEAPDFAEPSAPSRREFFATALAASFALAVTARPATAAPALGLAAEADALLPVTLKVNGKNRRLRLDPRVTLLDALREHLQMTGTKKGCDHGQCGACTVHLNGERVLSCLVLAASCSGDDVRTIEGLAKGDELHPVQAAFVEYDGYQCGYCTPGQIMSAVALLREGRAGSDAEIREGMSGNLCRCAAYPHILAAIKAARDGGKRV